VGDDPLSKTKAEYFKEYYDNNLDKIKETKRRYSKVNSEKLKIKSKQWHRENPEKSLWVAAKSRARRQGLPFNIEVTDVVFPKVCPILGIPILSAQEGKRSDNTPSVDKIIPSKGYVKGNVMVISWRANRLKSDASLEELEKLCEYLKGNIHANKTTPRRTLRPDGGRDG
jgi:hypothetical protein